MLVSCIQLSEFNDTYSFIRVQRINFINDCVTTEYNFQLLKERIFFTCLFQKCQQNYIMCKNINSSGSQPRQPAFPQIQIIFLTKTPLKWKCVNRTCSCLSGTQKIMERALLPSIQILQCLEKWLSFVKQTGEKKGVLLPHQRQSAFNTFNPKIMIQGKGKSRMLSYTVCGMTLADSSSNESASRPSRQLQLLVVSTGFCMSSGVWNICWHK